MNTGRPQGLKQRMRCSVDGCELAHAHYHREDPDYGEVIVDLQRRHRSIPDDVRTELIEDVYVAVGDMHHRDVTRVVDAVLTHLAPMGTTWGWRPGSAGVDFVELPVYRIRKP